MRYYNIFTSKEYQENGEQKKKWYRVGHMKETSNGGRFITMYHQPEVTLYVFENKDEEPFEEQ